MKENQEPLACYIAAFENGQIDSALAERGFSKGMLAFAIPSVGVAFRCRAEGDLLNLEFGALISLLEFLRLRVKTGRYRSLRVFSSNPRFVFAFSDEGRSEAGSPDLRKRLTKLAVGFTLLISYVDPVRNKALVPAADIPSVPLGVKGVIEPGQEDRRFGFRPFQNGLKL